MKKQSKKLTLLKETLVNLGRVTGGGTRETIQYTVLHPVETDGCTRGCVLEA